MIIEIRKTGFQNKGAELMLHAVIQQVREKFPDAKLTMAPITGGSSDTFEKMASLKLYPKAFFWRYGFDFGRLASIIPKKLRQLYGIVLTEDIDVILDAAGFSYSDQWGANSSRELASSSKIWKREGAKLILLPQAFGPFEDLRVRKYIKEWVANASLIFAREEDSYNHLTAVVGPLEKIQVSPDFTNLVSGSLPPNYDPSNKRIAIIPNYRMLDKTSSADSARYLPLLILIVKYILDQGGSPFVLVHESGKDMVLAEKICESVGEIPIVSESNPLHIKGIIGLCDATIGSRFHGLVSALSQGVPSLATGWSHKYRRLFDDYGFPEGMIDVKASDEEVCRKLDLVISPHIAYEIREKLNLKSELLKQRTKNMWSCIFKEIENIN